MAKDWVEFATINKLEPTDPARAKQFHKRFNNIMRGMKVPTAKQLKDEADNAYEIKKANNSFIMQGFKDKKLKSKKLIRQAQSMGGNATTKEEKK